MSKWDQIAADAANDTDEQFKNKISSLSRLQDSEILEVIYDSGISKADLARALKEVKHASKNNRDKAAAIKNISGGVEAVVGLLSKFI